MTTEHLILSQISMEFETDKGPFRALEQIDLKIAEGQLISIIGHSGCGKSTVLNIIAGLYEPTTGGVILDGKEVKGPGPERAVVFQNHSLLPWLTAYQNVALAVKRVFRGKKSRREMDEWIKHNLELVHMGHAMHKRPDEISGGMKQRVGIARALAMEPRVLLMDEPFGALDALTRAHMQDSLMEIHERLNNTVVMITHDVDEAVLLSDRIVMMTNGPAATIGEILDVDLIRPRNRLELAEDPDFTHYRAEVVRFLHERHVNPQRLMATEATTSEGGKGQVLDMAAWRERKGAGRRVEQRRVKLGFIPLTDCAPLVIAAERGLFEKHGVKVELSRESSWSNIRDKLAVGMLDGAHLLPGMALESALPGHSRATPLITALSLDLNGNAVTVSRELYQRLRETGLEGLESPLGAGRALRRVIEADRAAGRRTPTFSVVFPTSSHNFLLRYWLAAAGIDPDRDVRIIVVPPPQMVNYLRAKVISGFCVGEPWGAHAVSADLGRTLFTSHEVWNNHPEKVFGVTRAWAEANPNTHQALLGALLEACAWIDEAPNRPEVCEILSRGRYVNAPVDVLRMSMTGTYQFGAQHAPQQQSDFNLFHRYQANYPWRSHALWTLSQMVRWGQIERPVDLKRVAESVYRPDLYRQAAKSLGIAAPETEYKSEGEHSSNWQLVDGGGSAQLGADLFTDGKRFDPNGLVDYIDSFDIKAPAFPLSELASRAEKAPIADAALA